ncbi:unnamed protein product [Clonostachys rosea]|uniref:Uncharacterized protein n=1 Tax=Bionectria ochroleuca TaxID=29856 RepID=A0ABY6UGH4_BIOOC|nr:unnamed protein product [Clonostachys rosea]
MNEAGWIGSRVQQMVAEDQDPAAKTEWMKVSTSREPTNRLYVRTPAIAFVADAKVLRLKLSLGTKAASGCQVTY